MIPAIFVRNLRLRSAFFRYATYRRLPSLSDTFFRFSISVGDVQFRKIHSSHVRFGSFRRVDHYEVLGIARNASNRDIKKAYIELAKKYHPDANPGNTDAAKRFQEVAEAYSVLSNKQQRAAYDGNESSSGQGGGFENIRRSSATYESFHSSVDPDDLFRKIFGTEFNANTMRNAKRVWVDFAQTDGTDKTESTIVRLSFRESALGCDKMIRAKVITTCDKCMGIGSEPGKAIQMCPFCDGLGFEIIDGHDEKFRSTCRFCHGKGHNVVHKCTNCLGYGKTLEDRSVVIPIPPGIVDGETIKVNIEHADDDRMLGANDDPQQIFITFRVDRSNYFRLDDELPFDLHSDATISISQAIFGGRIKIDGLYSDETIVIEPGTDSHAVVKLPNKGLKMTTGYGYGDHYVHLKISIPTNLTDEQRRLLKSYAELESETVGEIDGIKRKATIKQQNLNEDDPETLERNYSGLDDEIGDDERRQRAAPNNISSNPWIRMFTEIAVQPVSRSIRLMKIFYASLLKKSK